ncbi:methyl-accepting chemotaxis protein [Desulfovibrio mangrovi]|uniref:methyl-accepting chemotaxis protein n=1 Tax=Desulfovibrio mangrovi TaxID=2976983 RepID=UPI0022477B64|nr:methyl-accepting chemotaxis protein [Desulfovibrio mangrovi]UZP66819.1 methyl-accepting chemotaxis protein [Desulfovibrio mangrovi]
MLRSITIGKRVLSLLIFMTLFMAISIFAFIRLTAEVSQAELQETQNVMLEDHKRRLKLATDTIAEALGVLIADAPTKEEQLEIIRKSIDKFRFEDDNSGYYFVYENTTVQVLPPKKELEGKDLKDLKDPNGVYLVRELNKAAHDGGGFVTYFWDKPGAGQTLKLGYANLIPGTDSWIGTGIYVDNVDMEKARIESKISDIVTTKTTWTLGTLAAVFLILVLPFSLTLIASIVRPLREATAAADAVAHGNLDVQLNTKGRDEVSNLQQSLNEMVATLKRNIQDMAAKEEEANRQAQSAREAAKRAEDAMLQAEKATREGMLTAAGRLEGVVSRISHATNDLATRSDEIRRGTENQMSRISETATAMEEMNATVLEVARNAGEAADQTEKSREKALQGSTVVSDTVKSMNDLQTLTTNLKGNMHKLGEQSVAIGQVMNVINDIADQTNLLALNAAIEAARAGDAGRGFAVVADEVRKLAEKTMGATKEVGESIKSIQGLAKANVDGMDEAVNAINGATDLSNQSGQMLYEIVSMAQDAAMQVQSIATAAEQQSAASEQITSSVDEINQIANENAHRVAESDRDIQQLAEEANELSSLIHSLKADAK